MELLRLALSHRHIGWLYLLSCPYFRQSRLRKICDYDLLLIMLNMFTCFLYVVCWPIFYGSWHSSCKIPADTLALSTTRLSRRIISSERVAMDLIFTCCTKDNQQGCFRLSNWFSLWRLGSWMNHLIVHFSAHILKLELVCKFRVRFHIFIIISCLGSRFHAWN